MTAARRPTVLLAGPLSALPEPRPGVELIVVAADAAGGAALPAGRRVAPTDVAAVLDAVRAADLVVVAGVRLGDDDPDPRMALAPLAALAGRPCALCDVEVGRLHSEAGRTRARLALEPADLVTVADAAARAAIVALGVAAERVHVADARESARLALALLDRPAPPGATPALAELLAAWGRGQRALLETREQEVAALTAESLDLQERLAALERSLSWRVTVPLRALSRGLRRLPSIPRRAAVIARSEGLPVLLRRVRRKLEAGLPAALARWPSRAGAAAQLERILAEHPDRPIIVARPFIDWHIPLFQRPQHLARSLAAQGFLYFFCTPNDRDRMRGFRQVAPACYLTDQFHLVDRLAPQVAHVYSTDHNCLLSWVKRHLARGDTVLYEYIDELHPDIGGRPITDAVWQKHRFLLKHEAEVLCVVSADKLHEDLARVRSRNLALVTNGVELERFAVERDPADVPAELADVVAAKRPIVGYFGALAKWFDYELVVELGRARPDYQVVLIGWSYDGSLERYRWKGLPNIRVLGPVEYAALPRYAAWFDVATIPFRVNDITRSTSPIKLFEYMALGKPIVTTALRECRKYRSVLVAETRESFPATVDRALGLRDDPAYRALLREEAALNTWAQKAAAIAALIRQARGA